MPIQVLESNSPSKQRMEALSKLMGSVGGGAEKLHGLLGERKERETLAKKYGHEFKEVRNPEIRKELLKGAIEKENQAAKLRQEIDTEKQDYDWIKKTYGKDIADFWKANTTGGRTKITEALIQQGLRHLSPQELFGAEGADEEEDILPKGQTPSLAPKAPKMIRNMQGEEFQLPDHSKRPKGFTQKDWLDKKEKWETRNSEIFNTNRDRTKSLERDILETKSLNNLNETRELPEGFDKLILNPNTGEPYGVAQLAELPNPETQAWVKVIARFGNRAKDAFGSRVTNFDLQQYMKQFPSLMNSYEGRKRILRMMDINYQLDYIYDKALQQIYDEVGLDGIAPNEADRLARQMVDNEKQKLEEEFLNLDRANTNEISMEGQKKQKPSLQEIFK
jgi:hypothetical protein